MVADVDNLREEFWDVLVWSSCSSHFVCAFVEDSSDLSRVFSNWSGAVLDVDRVVDAFSSVICAFSPLVVFCKRL